jgi:hypothetical protein
MIRLFSECTTGVLAFFDRPNLSTVEVLAKLPQKFLVSSTTERLIFVGGSLHQQRRDPMADNERGGSGNFANDPQRASEAGKKG